jgi:hypothetical protein
MLINNCSQDKHSVPTSEDKFKSVWMIQISSTNTNQSMKVWITRNSYKNQKWDVSQVHSTAISNHLSHTRYRTYGYKSTPLLNPCQFLNYMILPVNISNENDTDKLFSRVDLCEYGGIYVLFPFFYKWSYVNLTFITNI